MLALSARMAAATPSASRACALCITTRDCLCACCPATGFIIIRLPPPARGQTRPRRQCGRRGIPADGDDPQNSDRRRLGGSNGAGCTFSHLERAPTQMSEGHIIQSDPPAHTLSEYARHASAGPDTESAKFAQNWLKSR